MTFSGLFFQVLDSLALFITPRDQQLLTDSLSVMPCCISSEHSYVICKCNIQARGEYKRETEWCRESSEHFKYQFGEELDE